MLLSRLGLVMIMKKNMKNGMIKMYLTVTASVGQNHQLFSSYSWNTTKLTIIKYYSTTWFLNHYFTQWLNAIAQFTLYSLYTHKIHTLTWLSTQSRTSLVIQVSIGVFWSQNSPKMTLHTSNTSLKALISQTSSLLNPNS